MGEKGLGHATPRRHFGDIFGYFLSFFEKSTFLVDIDSRKWYTSPKAKRRKKMATNKKRVQVSFTDEQHKMLVDLAKEKGFSKSAIVVLALEEYLKSQKQK